MLLVSKGIENMEIDPNVVAQAALTGTWFWSNYGKEIGAQAIGALKTQWKKFDWNKASDRYRNRVKESCSTMRILYKTDTVPLDDQYVDLYVLDEKTADKRYGLDELQFAFDESMSFGRHDKRESARSIVNQYNYLFVYGKPGSGKTTLLKYFATLAAQKNINKVPIFISLSDWAYSKKGINDFIADQFGICGFPNAQMFIESLLDKGNALVLFDGLDEVSENTGDRDRIIREMDNFIKHYQRNKIIITCRIAASNYVFEGKEKFKYVEIADFSSLQVSAFVRKWFSHDLPKGEKFLNALNSELHLNLQELSQNPLLLGLLCLVFDKSSSFPANRAEIYRDAIDGLLSEWDSQQGVRRDKIALGFSSSVERGLLSMIAFDYFQKGEIFFDQDDLARQVVRFLEQLLGNNQKLDGTEIVKSIDEQHSLLTKRALHIYSFSHLTFQEYFTAQYVIDHSSEENLEKVLTQITKPRWNEVYRLIASLLPNADIFFSLFLRELKKIITKDQILVTVIKWAKQISTKTPKGEQAFYARMVAVDEIRQTEQFINRVRSLIEEHDYNVADSFARILNLELDVDIDRVDATDLVKVIILRRTFTKQLTQKFKKVLQLSHQRSTAFEENADFPVVTPINFDQMRIQMRENLVPATKHAEDELRIGIIDLAREFLPTEFRDVITTLDLPKLDPGLQEWKAFVSDIYSKTLGLRTSGKLLNLSDVHVLQIEQYIKANLLLIECLKTAKVSSQSEIKNSLFSL